MGSRVAKVCDTMRFRWLFGKKAVCNSEEHSKVTKHDSVDYITGTTDKVTPPVAAEQLEEPEGVAQGGDVVTEAQPSPCFSVPSAAAEEDALASARIASALVSEALRAAL